MYEKEQVNLWEGWWRWPLVPVASIIGAFLGAVVFMLLQFVSMKFSGHYNESGWYFQYILPLMRDGIFGFLAVFCGCMVAPRSKLIVGVVLTTLLGMLFFITVFFSFKGVPGMGMGLLSAVATLLGGIFGVVQSNDM